MPAWPIWTSRRCIIRPTLRWSPSCTTTGMGHSGRWRIAAYEGTGQGMRRIFSSPSGYHRILIALRQKYERFGRAAGTVQLPDASNAECEAARLLSAAHFPPLCDSRHPSLRRRSNRPDFKEYARKRCWRPILAWRSRLTVRFKKHRTDVLHPSSIRRQRTPAAKRVRSGSMRWKNAGQRILPAPPGGCKRSGIHPNRLAASVPEHGLAGAAIKGADPPGRAQRGGHLRSPRPDSGTRCGKLFQHLLSFRSGLSNPGTNVEQRDHLYYQNGILCDSISSLVTQIGLILSTETVEHPAYCLFRQRHEICTLSLANLAHVRGGQSLRPGLYRRKRNGFFTALRPGRTVPFSADLYLRPALRSGCAAAGSSGCERDTAVLLGRLRRKGACPSQDNCAHDTRICSNSGTWLPRTTNGAVRMKS